MMTEEDFILMGVTDWQRVDLIDQKIKGIDNEIKELTQERNKLIPKSSQGETWYIPAWQCQIQRKIENRIKEIKKGREECTKKNH